MLLYVNKGSKIIPTICRGGLNMNREKFKITLDKSVSSNQFFTRIKTIDIDKQLMFKYGILNEDVPSFIGENDFEYLQSKVPSLTEFYGDNIRIDKNRIISFASGENTKRISEIIGVGVCLRYAIELLQINPNRINKIPKPDTMIKYMDFVVNKDGHRYEIEAKGTTVHSNSKKNSLLKDIQEKKKASDKTACKFGVITIANKEDNLNDTEIIVCDDYEDVNNNFKDNIDRYISYYKFFLSFILDSTYYNRMMVKVDEGKIHENLIDVKKIKSKYEYNGVTYLGEYFDKRLVMSKISTNFQKDMTIDQIFNLLTQKEGIVKYFIGVDIRIIEYLNSLNVDGLSSYNIEKMIVDKENQNIIQDADGVIFVTASDNADGQVNGNFTEEEVRSRLASMVNFINGTPHECGAPCRSKEKEGEPCEILTYRDYCHFHR